MQRRGASRVVGSLWKVEDESTALLMRGCYRTLAEPGSTTADAQHSAQPYRHLYQWPGYFVSGSRP